MTDAQRVARATSFGGAAAAYSTGRPSYPAAAVAWLVGGATRVVDVGAGTGKLTAGLVAAGLEVVAAVDPDAAMLGTLQRDVPGVPALVGTAESVPLPDAAVDAAVLGQAWHWVDPDAASAELGRVVRPGGVLGLIWNIRDESEPWVAELGARMHGSDAEQMIGDAAVRVAAPFGPLDERRFPWTAARTPDEIVGDGLVAQLPHRTARSRARGGAGVDPGAARDASGDGRPRQGRAAVHHVRLPRPPRLTAIASRQ